MKSLVDKVINLLYIRLIQVEQKKLQFHQTLCARIK